MKRWIALLFLVTFAAALPHDQGRTQQVKREVTHRGEPATPAGARIPPPVKMPESRVKAVREVAAEPATHDEATTPVGTVAEPFVSTLAKPAVGAAPTFNTFRRIGDMPVGGGDALLRQIQRWLIDADGGIQPGYPGATQPALTLVPGPSYPAQPAYPAGPGIIWKLEPAGAYPYLLSYPQPPAQPEPPIQVPEASEEVPATSEEGHATPEKVPAPPEEVPAAPEEPSQGSEEGAASEAARTLHFDALPRQVQQWQIAVVGGQDQPGYPGAPQPPPAPAPGTGYPTYPAGPGIIWIHVPAGAYLYPPPYPQPPAPPEPPAQVRQAPNTTEEITTGE